MFIENENKFKRIFDSIDLEDEVIILDVDRTIINTTSWYQACVLPDLLISEEQIENFKQINDETFNNPDKDKLKKFRFNTLQMIERKVSRGFINRIENLDEIKKYFVENNYTDSLRFYGAGLYVSYNSVKIYEDAIKFIKFASRYYGNNLKILFLSAGYEPFINGVVDGILKQRSLTGINYFVAGSLLEFIGGEPKEIYHMSQIEKQKVIEYLINKGIKIRFL